MLGSLGVDETKVYKSIYLISPDWDIEFHIHTNVSLLTIGDMLTQNLIRKHD
jgi:uncharacterized protein (UPF0218 family)